MAKGPYLPNVRPLIEAGINPKTNLPFAFNDSIGTSPLKEGVKKALRIKDEQEFVNRGTWYNMPLDLSTQEIERLLYYKGSLAFFKLGESFYLMPYTLAEELDYYGRFKYITPIPIVGSSETKEQERSRQVLSAYLATKKFKVIREVALEEEFLDNDGNFNVSKAKDFVENSCVIINDYTPQLAQKIIARQLLQESIIDMESDCIPFMRTALLNSTGVQAMRVQSQDEQSNVTAASRLINNAALNGEKFIATVGGAEFQDLTGGNVAKSQEFMLAMQSIDNFRHSLLGIDNAGMFQKSQYVTDGQNQVNAGVVGLVAQDFITNRQTACDIINSIWGLGVWYDVNETVVGADLNMDGFAGEEQDQSGENKGNQGVETNEQ